MMSSACPWLYLVAGMWLKSTGTLFSSLNCDVPAEGSTEAITGLTTSVQLRKKPFQAHITSIIYTLSRLSSHKNTLTYVKLLMTESSMCSCEIVEVRECKDGRQRLGGWWQI
ncbi:hypothetical protein LDENG_00218940 [Lucifuga dentata]|nr:hypothetical protein LDENG_00218940 [Lucifuga dentata]